ncbi:ribbon-helix-helix domain-containing protein [Crocosphaera chwakensis]|uniref:CopG family transcriptional regulator n=1 Tax=Crocosphaera chwakensis CCY0110 TaxID=391612 RepID=A3IYS4_9CHRO|nr:hypothetical protein [Crocosphaera chwakensis]EAZ88365.1 hypothetical protein CY0110_04333 [Crocosphaera chwakensis CCY0110]
MNTSLYLPDELAKKLDNYVKNLQPGISKNKVIALAIEEFLNQKEIENQWSKEVMDWQGVEGFELDRSEGLLDINEEELDVFA